MVAVAKTDIAGPKATIIIRGKDYTEASSLDAKKLAIDEGTKHLGLCGISSSSSPYPVTLEGNEITTGEELAKLAAEQKETGKQTYCYQNDYILAQSTLR